MNPQFTKFPLPNPLLVATLDISPDGRTLVVGQQGDEESRLALGLWSLDDRRLVAPLVRDAGAIPLAARFSSSGRLLAYSDTDQNMVIYDLQSGKTDQGVFPLSFVKWMSFARTTDRLLAGGVRTQIWDADARAVIWTLPVDSLPPKRAIEPPHCALSPDAGLVAACGVEPTRILIYEVGTNEVVRRLETTIGDARSMAFDPSGRFLAAVAKNGVVGMWDLKSGDAILSDVFDVRANNYWCVQFHPDGEHVGFGLWTGFVKIVRIKDGRTVFRGDVPPHHGHVLDLAFSRDGKRMFTGGEDGAVLVWDLG